MWVTQSELLSSLNWTAFQITCRHRWDWIRSYRLIGLQSSAKVESHSASPSYLTAYFSASPLQPKHNQCVFAIGPNCGNFPNTGLLFTWWPQITAESWLNSKVLCVRLRIFITVFISLISWKRDLCFCNILNGQTKLDKNYDR